MTPSDFAYTPLGIDIRQCQELKFRVTLRFSSKQATNQITNMSVNNPANQPSTTQLSASHSNLFFSTLIAHESAEAVFSVHNVFTRVTIQYNERIQTGNTSTVGRVAVTFNGALCCLYFKLGIFINNALGRLAVRLTF